MCKFGKVLKACQEQRHCFVIPCTPEQVHRTKPKKCLNQSKDAMDNRETMHQMQDLNIELRTFPTSLHMLANKKDKIAW